MIDTCQHIVDSMVCHNGQMNALLTEQDSILNTISKDVSILIENGTDYTPEIKVFAIPLIIAISTIMVSLIFSIVNRIDSKYSAKQFVKLYLNHWTIISFGIVVVLCLFAIIVYAILRRSTPPSLWNIILCTLAIALFVSAVFTFWRAIQFNNSQKLLSEVFAKYNSGLCTEKEQQEFYSLCTHLVHYAIISDISLLHEFVNRFSKEHLLKLHDFTEGLYNALIDIAADYKEKEDDLEVNATLAYLFASLVDTSSAGNTKQDTYNALYHILCICNRNKHYSLINELQRKMRYVYYDIRSNAQTNRIERYNRLQLFVLSLNALLYGKKSKECVDDAIRNNYDAIIIGDGTIIPQTANQCLDLYLYLREVLMDGKDFSYFFYVASDFTSFTNATLLNRYLSGYFAYLISKLHQCKLTSEDILNSVYIKEENINYSFDALIKNAPDENSKTYIKGLRDSYEVCRNEFIRSEEINIGLCEGEITKQIKDKQFSSFKGLVSDIPLYMEDAETVLHPIMELKAIKRVVLLERNISSDIHFFEHYDFGSRTIECVMDALAEVYNSYQRIEETIHRADVNKRWCEFVKRYDYNFLSFKVDVPNKVLPFGEKFSTYFPPRCIIVISIPDLPYLEWKGNCNILSIEDVKINKNESPKVNMQVDLHMNIRYKKNTQIHVLKVVD